MPCCSLSFGLPVYPSSASSIVAHLPHRERNGSYLIIPKLGTVRTVAHNMHLHSTHQLLSSKQTTRTVISSHAFSRADPTIWNSLPYDIRLADSFGRFGQSSTVYSSLLTSISLTLHFTARTRDSVTRRHTGALSKTFNNNNNVHNFKWVNLISYTIMWRSIMYKYADGSRLG